MVGYVRPSLVFPYLLFFLFFPHYENRVNQIKIFITHKLICSYYNNTHITILKYATFYLTPERVSCSAAFIVCSPLHIVFCTLHFKQIGSMFHSNKAGFSTRTTNSTQLFTRECGESRRSPR